MELLARVIATGTLALWILCPEFMEQAQGKEMKWLVRILTLACCVTLLWFAEPKR